MRSNLVAATVLTGVVALLGFAGSANASATIDLIWIDKTDVACIDANRRDCPQLGRVIGSVALTDHITLAVIATAGPGGLLGAAVSVDYGDALPLLGVSGFQSLTTEPFLTTQLGETSDIPPFIDNIQAIAAPSVGAGIGLPADASAYLGTVTFHKDLEVTGFFEIGVGINGPSMIDGVLNLAQESIVSTTTFNSAQVFNVSEPPPGCDVNGIPMVIEINALRAGGKTVKVGANQSVDVTAKARILKGTAPADTTLVTTLTLDVFDGSVRLDTQTQPGITLAVGKGGTGATLPMATEQCDSGFLTFVAEFRGSDADGDDCVGERTLRKACR